MKQYRLKVNSILKRVAKGACDTVTCLMKTLGSLTKLLLSQLNSHSNLIVASATIALALITWSYIYEAKQMRLETKRLADISVEQFKIRAYPSFIISPEIVLESDKLAQTVNITNRGEIAAHRLTVLVVTGFSQKEQMRYICHTGTVYKGTNSEQTTLDFENDLLPNGQTTIEFKKDILPNGTIIIGTERTSHVNYSIDTLKCLLVILKFRVPYDDKYSYKVAGYVLKDTDPGHIWQNISQEDTQVLMSTLFRRVPELNNEKVDRFFADYEHMK